MHVVIDIPEDEYKICLSHRESIENMIRVHKCFSLEYAVVRGTPLPEGCDIQRIIPKRVDVQKWIYTECPNPNCNYELSIHHGDGYYSIEDEPSFCPNCGQALLWESEG